MDLEILYLKSSYIDSIVLLIIYSLSSFSLQISKHSFLNQDTFTFSLVTFSLK